jgi:hypothetical protein
MTLKFVLIILDELVLNVFLFQLKNQITLFDQHCKDVFAETPYPAFIRL